MNPAPALCALVADPTGTVLCLVRGDGNGATVVADGPLSEVAERIREWDATNDVRWVWWDRTPAEALVANGIRLRRCWDIAEAQRLIYGGYEASPDLAWAVATGLDPALLPPWLSGDLFEERADGGDGVLPTGFLNPVVFERDWLAIAENRARWGHLALTVAQRQREALNARPRGVSAAMSESGTGLLCAELRFDGLPIDRHELNRILTSTIGPPPTSQAEAAAVRASRDQRVLDTVPGRGHIDLRNPAQVRDLLSSVGVVVPDTRAHHLEPYADTHPVVAALLTWRKAERIATTYGWSWADRFIGPDDRLRGEWTVCDGGAGRMTASAGLHSLPAPLRPSVAAHAGHVFVRADLGQVEPRVLAVVSGDRALAAATIQDDLYATVAQQLQLDRPTAKIAVLAAMYGQTSGPAADALNRMQRTYPRAIEFLSAAAARGERGEPVRTFGGRHIPVGSGGDQNATRARGRFARNAVVQGSAAELFKAWALTVRAAIQPMHAQIVLCLHDELLVHAPEDVADEVQAAVTDSLNAAARRWSGGAPVRFVADTSVIHRWSQAKG